MQEMARMYKYYLWGTDDATVQGLDISDSEKENFESDKYNNKRASKRPTSIITIINRPLAAKLNANAIKHPYSTPHPATVAVTAAAASS